MSGFLETIYLINSNNCMQLGIKKLHDFVANLSVWVVYYKRNLEKKSVLYDTNDLYLYIY